MFKRTRLPPRLMALGVLTALAAIVYLVGDHPMSTGPAAGTAFIGAPTTRQVDSDQLMIATFNIDSGKGEDGHVDLARTARCLQKPDFVGLNEVHGFLWGQPENQAVELSDLLHLPYLWVPVEKRWGRETFGNAAFTHLQVMSWKRVDLPSYRFSAKRNYLETIVQWHGELIHIITAHTDWKPGGEGQFEIVRDEFLKLPTPAILMGDLNTPPSSPLIQDLKSKAGVEEAIDQIYDKIPGRVDWIFLRGLHTKDAAPVNLKASDHPAYWASVVLKQDTPWRAEAPVHQ